MPRDTLALWTLAPQALSNGRTSSPSIGVDITNTVHWKAKKPTEDIDWPIDEAIE